MLNHCQPSLSNNDLEIKQFICEVSLGETGDPAVDVTQNKEDVGWRMINKVRSRQSPPGVTRSILTRRVAPGAGPVPVPRSGRRRPPSVGTGRPPADRRLRRVSSGGQSLPVPVPVVPVPAGPLAGPGGSAHVDPGGGSVRPLRDAEVHSDLLPVQLCQQRTVKCISSDDHHLPASAMAFLASVASSTFSKVTKAKPRDRPVFPSSTTVILAMGPNLLNSLSSSLSVV